MQRPYDAIIIGGGPGGATAALLLARGGWNVALVEQKAFPRRKVCGEYLSGTNRALFRHLGIGELFDEAAGPEVRRVGLFAQNSVLLAKLPRPGAEWGRALGREHLDTMLLEHAASHGANILQPWNATSLQRDGNSYLCRAQSAETGESVEMRANVAIAAHGSWAAGPLRTQLERIPNRPGDLFGFKAHFRNSNLPEDLMPLLAFPGGYGGMVHTDDGRVSLSCCIRRDRLAKIRGTRSAGEDTLAHIIDSCRGVRESLSGATVEGAWLAAGPIRPGIRLQMPDGIFPVGNLAGEAHPAVAEGISMAMQSAWLLTRQLSGWRKDGGKPEMLKRVGAEYSRDWRRYFAPRLRAAAFIAWWAMHPALVSASLPMLRAFPCMLNWGARLSGKARRIAA